ncbi:MAG: hypothetical protein CMO34_03095 [Verrucomicrobia bacterium]|nr:hypothetical protein [Verrucomicrobiota bacterium]|tara:strand:- start:1613 stop:1873 length:261 start_codon:yes stop_codon:yes gene_type:complete
MEISVELTLTPLQEQFEEPIIQFIKRLRASGLTVLENPLSTQVYGKYEDVMQCLNTEIERSFKDLDHVVLLMKIVKTDRSDSRAEF